MKLKKLTLIAALAMFSLSGAANAMLPLMFLVMGPMMGGGMMGMGGHGESVQDASHTGEHRHDSAAGTPGSVDADGTNRPSADGVGSGRMKSDDGGHERH